MTYGPILIPFISAFTGWFTLWIATRMLFYPRQPRKVLWFTLQGILPKKQQQFAEKLGRLLSDELLLFHSIEETITRPGNIKKIMPRVEGHIDHFLRVKLPEQMPVISMFIGDKTITELKGVFTAELEALFPVIMKDYMNTLREDLNLEKIMLDKLSSFSSAKFQQALASSMSKEFRVVGIIAGVVGFLIGLLEAFLTLL
jgi:uncharacterized membrane protein YheB (UPF0754 family)